MIAMAIANRLRGVIDDAPVHFNFIPADEQIAIMVDSPIPGFELDPELPGYFNDMFEVVIRHTTARHGLELCRQAVDKLVITNQRFGDYHFNFIRAITEPAVYPTAKSGLREFAVRFEFSCYQAI